jgi:hypothetical protein
MRGFESVGATEPHLIVTAGGVAGCCKLTLVDGTIAHVLSIVDAAEKLVSLSIAGLGGEYFVKANGCFIDSALLKKSVGLAYVGPEKVNAEEEEKRKGKAHAGQEWHDEHV